MCVLPVLHKYPVSPRELKARCDAPVVQLVKTMLGLEMTVIKEVIYRRLCEEGENFKTGEELAEAVLDLMNET